MAVRQIAITDTLETFRTQFNELASDDFGDIATLSGAGLSSTSVIGAVIELSAIVAAGQGFFIEDASSTRQLVGAGQTLRFFGTANQLNAVVSTPDTLTVSLTDDVNITNNLSIGGNFTATGITATGTTHTLGTVEIVGNTIRSTDSTRLFINDNLSIGGNFTATGTTHTLGTVEIVGNTIRSTDSTRLFINDTLRATGLATENGRLRIDETGDFGRISSTRGDGILVFDATPIFNSSLLFEGSTSDDFETTVTVTDPTADRTITIPNITGTLVTTGDTGSVTSAMILDGTITTNDLGNQQVTEAKMADDAIGQNQLKNVVALSILNSAGGVLKTMYGAGA